VLARSVESLPAHAAVQGRHYPGVPRRHRHKPDTTFGNVIADKEPHFHRGNFCNVIRCSRWHG